VRMRCASTVPASSSCNTQTITKWVVDISNFIKTLDSKHLVTAGHLVLLDISNQIADVLLLVMAVSIALVAQNFMPRSRPHSQARCSLDPRSMAALE